MVIDVDDDQEIEVDLPFALATTMTISLSSGGVAEPPILVSDYYTAVVGKFKVEAAFDPGMVDVSTLSPTLDMEIKFGAEGFPGTFAIDPTEWKSIKPKEWKYKQE